MNATVMNVDIAKPRVPGHEQFWWQCDILDASGLKQAVSDFRPTDVIHLSARTDLHGQEVREYTLIGLLFVTAPEPDADRVRAESPAPVVRD